MSRIGKLPIKLDDKVKAAVAGDQVNFEGPKGKLSVKIPDSRIKVSVKDGTMVCERPNDERKIRALHGLTRSILANAAKGVATGWEKALAIRGVGFRAEVKGKQVHFSLGYSHPVVFNLPEGVTAEVGKAPRTEDTLPTIDLTLRSVEPRAGGQDGARDSRAEAARAVQGQGHQAARRDGAPQGRQDRHRVTFNPIIRAVEDPIARGRKDETTMSKKPARQYRKERIRKKLSAPPSARG